MRYIGNKTKLLERIYNAIEKRGISGNSFFDVFSGTASVAKFFKQKGYEVFSSDLLFMSYCLQRAYITNNTEPKFKKLLPTLDSCCPQSLLDTPMDKVLCFINNCVPDKQGFIYKNYSVGGTQHLKQPRMYLSDENAAKIDSIRQTIEQWHTKDLITEDEYYVLLACLLENVSLFTNVAGVYAAFQKKWDPRAIKPFVIKPIELCIGKKAGKAFNANSRDLLSVIEADIFYLDPPYNERQYAPNYHLLETIVKYDNPEVHGVTGMRDYSEQKSGFCRKGTALAELEEIVKNAKCNYLLLSYNNEGIMPQEDILNIMNKYGQTELVEFKYARYKSNSKGSAANTTAVKEQLYIVKLLRL